jgi:hypothetical protein
MRNPLMSERTSGVRQPWTLSRRRFLVGATAAAATPALVGLAGALLDGGPAIDLDDLGVPRLSLGYIEGSDRFEQLGRPDLLRRAALTGGSVRPAAAARRGDSALVGRVVRVTIHGLYPSSAALGSTLRGLSVNGLFASRDPDAPYPFYAWTLQGGGAPTMGRRSIFQVELDRNPRFGVALELGTASGRETAAAVFGTGSGSELTKLRAGAYLVPVGHDGWARGRALPREGDPAWDRLPSVILTVEPVAA